MELLKLADKYSEAKLEEACKKALTYTNTPSFKSIKNLLVTMSNSLETEPVQEETVKKNQASQEVPAIMEVKDNA